MAKDQPGQVVVWDAKTGCAVVEQLSFPSPRVVRFAPDGKTLAVATGNKVLFLDAASGKAVGEKMPIRRPLSPSHLGHRENWPLPPDDGVVRVWDMKDRKNSSRHPPIGKALFDWRLSPDGKWLAGADQQQAYQSDATTGKIRKFDDSGLYTAGAAFSADGACCFAALAMRAQFRSAIPPAANLDHH